MSGHGKPRGESSAPAESSNNKRLAWTSPAVTRMQAGDAEMPGDNPIIPEGFAMGS